MRTKIAFSAMALLLGTLFMPLAWAQKARASTRSVALQNRGTSYLGIGVAEIDSENAKTLNLKEERGVEVKSVDENSPAAKAGLKEGDVVLEYNGQRVEGTEQFVRLVRETPPGRRSTLLIWRNGATQSITATLGTRASGFKFTTEGEWPFEIRMPEMPPMPDLPGTRLSWRSSTLGIESESLGPQLAEFFGVKEGVLVRSVEKGSAAEKAGVKAGDVITKVGDTNVTSSREIANALRGLKSSPTFPVTVVRDRKELKLSLTLPPNPKLRGLAPAEPLKTRFC